MDQGQLVLGEIARAFETPDSLEHGERAAAVAGDGFGTREGARQDRILRRFGMGGFEDFDRIAGLAQLHENLANHPPRGQVLGIEFRRAPAAFERRLIVAGQVAHPRGVGVDDQAEGIELAGTIRFANRLVGSREGHQHGAVATVRVLLAGIERDRLHVRRLCAAPVPLEHAAHIGKRKMAFEQFGLELERTLRRRTRRLEHTPRLLAVVHGARDVGTRQAGIARERNADRSAAPRRMTTTPARALRRRASRQANPHSASTSGSSSTGPSDTPGTPTRRSTRRGCVRLARDVSGTSSRASDSAMRAAISDCTWRQSVRWRS